MRYRESGSLDTSGVRDTRGRGGRGGAAGGSPWAAAGWAWSGWSSSCCCRSWAVGTAEAVRLSAPSPGWARTRRTTRRWSRDCRTGADANESVECAVVADVESIQDYWSGVLGDQYDPTETNFFTGSVQTACGGASSGSGPFYCPADQLVYIDLTFFDQLQRAVRRPGRAVRRRLRHRPRVRPPRAEPARHQRAGHARARPGPTSGSVRLELQADCYAGAWANHAETVPDDSGEPLIADITEDDIDRALDAAARIGDDYIQENLGGGTVDQEAFTHGSSEQRQKWFRTGYETGDPRPLRHLRHRRPGLR